MEATTVARNYGEVLFELAEQTAAHEEYASSLDELVALLESEPKLRTFLETPKLSAEEKKRVLREALADRVARPFLTFLMVVIDKRRQRLLQSIARAYRLLLDEKLGRLNVDVILARQPDAAELRAIAEQLSRVLESEVIPHVRVNEDILGGIVVRYQDRVIDGSLRRRLNALRGRLLQTKTVASA